MAVKHVVVDLFVLVALLLTTTVTKAIESRPGIIGHVVPHSHCDAAYKKTVYEYYETEVRLILNNVIPSLIGSSQRRFVWAETIFLTQWWHDPRTQIQLKKQFRTLLRQGRLEIVNGGWVMHDESITRYESQIQQMAYGHKSIQDLLSSLDDDDDLENNSGNESIQEEPIKIETGWQIDPFGPAANTVNLHDWAHMPFLVHNRIPQYLKEELMTNQSLQFIWKVNPGTTTTQTQVLVHVLDHHYDSPRGFDWESLGHVSDPITNDNVQQKSDAYMAIVKNRSRYFRTPHNILMPFGDDFRFVNATREFYNMDQIVDFVRQHPERYSNATLRYSTPREYRVALLNSLRDTHSKTETKEGVVKDLPTITGSPFLNYWTGYYTQLPVLKQMVRSCEIVLRTLQMMRWSHFAVEKSDPFTHEWLQHAQETVWLMQHHDAITSTSYRFVLVDYMKRLQHAFEIMTHLLWKELTIPPTDSERMLPSPLPLSQYSKAQIVGGGPYLHESVLVRGSQSARTIALDRIVDPNMGQHQSGIELIVLNSLARDVDTLVSFVCTRDDVAVVEHINGKQQAVMSQATPLEKELESPNLGLFLISFRAKIASLDKSRYSIKVCRLTWTTEQDSYNPPILPGLKCSIPAKQVSDLDTVRQGLSSDIIHVDFDEDTHDISHISVFDGQQYTKLKVSHDIIIYNGQNDTIYDMRTSVPFSNPHPLHHERRIVESYQGILFSQVTIEINEWLRVRYRVMNVTDTDSASSFSNVGASLGTLLEVSMLAGPVPPLVNVASRLQTNLGKGTKWFYDENGFLVVEGSWNASLGVGYNVRPLVSRAWLKEPNISTAASCPRTLMVHSVDPRGVLSRGDGAIEVFWKRRNHRTGTEDTSDSDWWKQGEDISCSRSSVWLALECLQEDKRQLSLQLSNDVVALRLPQSIEHNRIVREANFGLLSNSASLPRELHVLSVDVKDRSSFSKKGKEIWIDIQIENLSEQTGKEEEVPIAYLLSPDLNGRLKNVSLRSLTFLYPQRGNRTSHVNDGSSPPCTLNSMSSDGVQGQFLRVRPRRICSVRFMLSLSPRLMDKVST